jgi:hypothetical protein
MLKFVLFLDFDGVLHPRTSGTMRLAPLLEAFLRCSPNVSVVISSSWRALYSLEELRTWFSDDVQHRFLSCTPRLPDGAGSRQREIEKWLSSNPAHRWAALDDEAGLFDKDCPWLVLTEAATGVTAADLETLEILALS